MLTVAAEQGEGLREAGGHYIMRSFIKYIRVIKSRGMCV
jgi:hypothetical protein